MKNSSLYTAEDILRVNSLVNEGRKRIRVDKYGGGGATVLKNGSGHVGESNSNSSQLATPPTADANTTVPEGWRIRTTAKGTVTITAPDGVSFESRSAALRHMVLSGYSAEEREEMRAHLHHEGWADSPLLPAGWKLLRAQGWRSHRDKFGENIEILCTVPEDYLTNFSHRC
jgi:hypothetical protein